ncbi:LLM class flavin-dependent oxidoreductase [Streptomyces sp. NPDC007084]|uniref:LLM class flavin-dependent oxidoreductase n=1 Tax=Streptomyces sp. NPDC007084 TaxID=3154313 RepID=UPI0034528BD9
MTRLDDGRQPMRFSMYVIPQSRGADDDQEIIETQVEHCLRADEAGFDAVYLTEHHFNGFNTYADPFMLGAHLAGQFKQAHIGISVAAVPLWNPLRLVEQCNLLDVLTRGRCIIGLAPGGNPAEAAGLGRDASQRHSLMEETLDVMLRAWDHPDGEKFEYAITHEKGTMAGRVMPASFRRPRPLLARATHTDDTIARAGREGWPVMFGRFEPTAGRAKVDLYRAALAEGGHDDELVRECLDWLAVTQMIHVAETDEQAWAEVEPALEAFRSFGSKPSKDGAGDWAKGSYRGVSGDRETFVNQAVTVGSPDTVAARLQEFADNGVPHVRTMFSFGYAPRERVDRSIELFTSEVMPRFSRRPLEYDLRKADDKVTLGAKASADGTY